jgi:hypothetical protein
MADFSAAKAFLQAQHLGPLLSAVTQSLVTLNKWDTVGKALQVCYEIVLRIAAAAYSDLAGLFGLRSLVVCASGNGPVVACNALTC